MSAVVGRNRMSGPATALLGGGALLAASAFSFVPRAAQHALDQVWPPFALVAGLLLVGFVAAEDGVFAWAGASLSRLPGSSRLLFAELLGLVAVTSALLNLDTAVVFLTPVLLHAARRRAVPEAPFLYGAVFMANSASLLLPGSNLTNLMVLAHEHLGGGSFVRQMAPAWVAAVIMTWFMLAVLHRGDLRASHVAATTSEPVTVGLGMGAVVVVLLLMVMLDQPALWVLAVGLAVTGIRLAARRSDVGDAATAANPALLLGLLGIAVALGTLARVWDTPSQLITGAGAWSAMGIGTLAAITLNNLPAAALLSSHVAAHPRALLLGLNLGPNLAISGSLSAMLWLRVARANGAKPSIREYSRQGVLVAVPALVIALALLMVVSPHHT
jgi:arsenical pump membrane protein